MQLSCGHFSFENQFIEREKHLLKASLEAGLRGGWMDGGGGGGGGGGGRNIIHSSDTWPPSKQPLPFSFFICLFVLHFYRSIIFSQGAS